jgi:predicted nucleic acid-binding protein
MQGWLGDTSAITRWRRPEVRPTLERLLEVGLLWTCPPIDLEVLFSARSPRDYTRVQSQRRAAYRLAPLNDAVGERALWFQAELARRSKHRAVGVNDLLIAATAVENDLVVLHYDRDFDVLGEICGVPHQAVAPLGTIP